VCVERSEVTCGPDVDGFSIASVFNDFWSDVAKRTGERGELLVGGVEEFGSMKKMKEQRGGKWMGDSHSKVDDDNVTVRVLGAVENVFGSVTRVKRQRERERKSSVLEVSVDDAVAVKAVDGIENRADDNNNIVLGKLALREDAVKQLSASSKFKGEIVFCTRLKALVKLDLVLG